MIFRKSLAFILVLWAVITVAPGAAEAVTPGQRIVLFSGPGWVLHGATYDLDCANNRFFVQGRTAPPGAVLTVSRASVGTDLLPTSPSGYAYNTFQSGQLRITSGLGCLIEESRINRLLNSATPATQTTASLATGTYTLWVNGSGSATMSSGTATGCGTSAASQGTPVNFTITVAGTCTVTVSGSLNAFQLELGAFGTSFIPTAGAIVTRATDIVTLSGLTGFANGMSIYATGTPEAPNSTPNNQVIASLSDGTNNNRFQVGRLGSPAGASNLALIRSGSSLWNQNGGTWNQATLGKFTAYAIPGLQAAQFDGVALTGATSATIPSVSVLDVGARADGGVLFDGYISRIAVAPTSLLTD